MNHFTNLLKVIHVRNVYVLAWLDPDGNIRQKHFPSRLIRRAFTKVLKQLLNEGFCSRTGIFFGDRSPRKELKEFILMH